MLADSIIISPDLASSDMNEFTMNEYASPNTTALQRIEFSFYDQQVPLRWTQSFVNILVDIDRFPLLLISEAYQTMLASENILRQDWDQPEEDLAWADL